MFFQELQSLMQDKTAIITVQNSGEKQVIMVTIKSSQEGFIAPKPIILSGLAKEIDENFFSVINKPLIAIEKFMTNVDDVVESIETQKKPSKAVSKAKPSKSTTKVESSEQEPQEEAKKEVVAIKALTPFEEFMVAGEKYMEEGDYEKAVEEYKLAVSCKPKDANAASLLYKAREAKMKKENGFDVPLPKKEESKITPNENFEKEEIIEPSIDEKEFIEAIEEYNEEKEEDDEDFDLPQSFNANSF